MFLLKKGETYSIASHLFENDDQFISLAKKINDKIFIIKGTENKKKLNPKLNINNLKISNNQLIIKNGIFEKSFELMEI